MRSLTIVIVAAAVGFGACQESGEKVAASGKGTAKEPVAKPCSRSSSAWRQG